MNLKLFAGFVTATAMCFGAAFGTSAQGELIGSRSEPTQLIVGGSYVGAPTLIFSWEISYSGGLWHYEYTFDGVPRPEISHFILSLSPDCTSATVGCVQNYDGPDAILAYGTFTGGSGDPGFPAGKSIQGIKFDDLDDPGSPFIVTFESTRAPVYGHLYGKGASDSYFYNAGLATPSDSIYDYVARPNGANPPDDDPVPEPATLALFGIGAVALGLYRRVR